MRDRAYCLSLLNEMAKSTKANITVITVEIYLRHLEPHGWDRIANGLEKLFADLRRFPTIKEILEASGHLTALTPEEEADALVEKIFYAGSRFGFRRVDEAAAYIGPKAWPVALRHWEEITESEVENRTTLRAQIRRAVTAELAMQRIDSSQQQIAQNGFDAMKFISEANK